MPDSLLNIACMLGIAFILIPTLAYNAAGVLVPAAGTARQVAGLALQNLLLGLVIGWHFSANLGLRLPALTPAPGWRQVRLGACAGLILLAVNGVGLWLARRAAAALIGPARAMALYYKEESVLMGIFRYESAWPLLAALFLTVTVLAPLVEELYFRGYVYNALHAHIGKHAIWVSSILFTMPHGYIIHGVPVFLLALCLAWLYDRERSLWVNGIAHGVMNGLVAVYLLIMR